MSQKEANEPVLAVRAFWANPKTGREIKGCARTTVYGTGADKPPILMRLARRLYSHMGVREGTLPPKAPKKYALEVR